MQKSIRFQELNILNELIKDYLFDKKDLAPFITDFPSKESLIKFKESRADFPQKSRTLIQEVFRDQYRDITSKIEVDESIELLGKDNCFTITTGHQLGLATGPLFFIYKIIHTIKMANELNSLWKDTSVVPIFWMASEDHDFEEINHFHLFRKNLSWESKENGAVGRMKLESITDLLAEVKEILGNAPHAESIMNWLQAYEQEENLASATRRLTHELFGKYGLLILDADDHRLKKQFAPIIKREILEQKAKKKVEATNTQLESLNYKNQAYAREINLFLLEEGKRYRIKQVNEEFRLVDSDIRLSKEEILDRLANKPEDFSPNVILRPVYQELILPNLCYIGGGGEISYWLQLKGVFDLYNVPFPILQPRNSVLLLDKRNVQRLTDFKIAVKDLFDDVEHAINLWISDKVDIDLEKQKEELHHIFKKIEQGIEEIDTTLIKTVRAEEQKQINALENLEKRIVKAAKNRQDIEVNQIRKIHAKIFPESVLQERKQNIIEYWSRYGLDFLEDIYHEMDPFEPRMIIHEIT